MQVLQTVMMLNLSSIKAKLLENTEADGANVILKNATTTVPLQYLINFRRSFEMSLINCKIELKRKWTMYCVSSAAGNENDVNNNYNPNNIIFTIKYTKLYVPIVNLSAREAKSIKTS